MKIWILNHEFPPLGQGGATASEMLARTLSQDGHVVTIFTTGWQGLPDKEKKKGYMIFRIASRRKLKERSTPLEMLSFIRKTRKIVFREAQRIIPDGTIAFFGFPAGVVARDLMRRYRIPYIVSARGHDVPGFLPDRYKWHHRILMPLLRSVWKEAICVVANSRSLEKKLQKVNPLPSIRYIPNGVDSAIFFPNRQFKGEKKTNRLLFVGRLTEQKGLSYLLNALSVLSKKHPALLLRLVGEGELRPALEKQTSRLGLKKTVSFLGLLSRESVLSEYQKADIFVLPSLDEGMSNSLLEAMACGLPVLTTDAGDNARLVVSGAQGLVVPSANEKALADGLQRLLKNTEGRSHMAKASRQSALDWTWDTVAKQYIELFKLSPI